MANETFLTVTLGCKVNTYESQGIAEYLKKQGLLESAEPDYIVVNTCAVTQTAERKCLTKVRSLGKCFPAAKIAVVGCSSALHPESFFAIPNVFVVGGNDGKIAAVQELLTGGSKVILSKKNLRNERYESEIKISRFGDECRAFLKIQDGCDNFCSYCIIPRTRGNSRSRRKSDILQEAQRLFAADYREIVITGIDMGSYRDSDGSGLEDLIAAMIAITPRGSRLRISSLETHQISRGLMDLFVQHPDKLVSHIHIPLQSGSNAIIELMHRQYDLDEFARKVELLRAERPYLGLSTDVIVGFPGETETLFKETYRFIEKLKFMRLHIFPFSPRPSTPAAALENQVSGSDKKDRVRRLLELGKKLQDEFIDYCHGQIFTFLAEKVIKSDGRMFFQGYLDNYLEIKIESPQDLLGKLTKVQILNREFFLVEN